MSSAVINLHEVLAIRRPATQTLTPEQVHLRSTKPPPPMETLQYRAVYTSFFKEDTKSPAVL